MQQGSSTYFGIKRCVNGKGKRTISNLCVCDQEKYKDEVNKNDCKFLIDRDMMKKDLREKAGFTTNVICKLGKNENVSTEVLCKICDALNCEVDDIVDFIPE